MLGKNSEKSIKAGPTKSSSDKKRIKPPESIANEALSQLSYTPKTFL
ncbi:MAG TPA: hypothetical protein VNK24_09150 [Elusimicrobiota bacterium]|nr:hypothetical protein [Elusimicrobiota bacterium]